jgi:ATP-dependent DNA helicase RecG
MSMPVSPHSPPKPFDLEGLLARAPGYRGMRPDVAELLAKVAGGPLTRDALFLAPIGAIDRRNRVAIGDAREGEIATIEAEVDRHIAPGRSKAPYRVRLRDDTGFLTVVYFRPRVEMLKRMWPIGQRRLLSGKIEVFGGERQMTHPDYVVDPARGEAPPNVEPVYPLTAGLVGRQVQKTIAAALERLGEAPEWLSASNMAAMKLMPFSQALRLLHRPDAPEDVAVHGPARLRLAFDELFARQCALRLRRAERCERAGMRLIAKGDKAASILKALPFSPTQAQARAFQEIRTDLAGPAPMLRLLQGDVGSGKTLVAALAMAEAAEAGAQSALMAPTEILARQHAAGLIPLLAQAGLALAVLTGRDKGKERAAILDGLASGRIAAVVGTHALFQDHVAFARLGLVVIDEQHRFGVSDRARLVAKGDEPNVLVMSATPIPRTLALSVHGDMDLSVLDEKPPGRKPIRTAALPTSRLEDVIDAITRAMERDERAYWVCPLIAESELSDLAAVEERFEYLHEYFGDIVALLHGKMAPSARESAMARFVDGRAKLLVATTVIEVGVNVAEASIMVIEHAERFGLAQLHQLRGRVGRGELPGHCLLLWQPPLSETAKKRLDALRRSEDGFAIAELDYEMRGSGDILGVRQSGLPPFRFVNPEEHGKLLLSADREARMAIDADPGLNSARGQAIRTALHLFGYETEQDFVQSG